LDDGCLQFNVEFLKGDYMSFLDDIGDAFSSVASTFAEPLLNAAPAIGGFLGNAIGGPQGAALGKSLGGLGGNLIRGISGMGGGGGGGSPQQQQQQYSSQPSPMSNSLMPTPSPNIAGMPGVQGWPQYQQGNFGGQGGFGGDAFGGGMGGGMFSNPFSSMFNNFSNQYVPQQYQNASFGQIPGMMGQQFGNWAGNQIAPSMPGLGGLFGSIGQGLGNRFSDQLGSYFGNDFMQNRFNQIPDMMSSGFNNMINPYMQGPMSGGGGQGRGSNMGSPVVPSPRPSFGSQPYQPPIPDIGVD
jgi:hypothetical protein